MKAAEGNKMKKLLSFLISILIILGLIVPAGAYGDGVNEIEDVGSFAVTEESEALLTVNTAAELNISARAWLLMDRNTGKVLLAHNEH